MIDHKNFFRKLDALLAKIGKQRTGKNFLIQILKELEETFGAELKISRGRLYEALGEEFVLISPRQLVGKPKIAQRLTITDRPVQLVLEHGSYIFDDSQISIDEEINNQREYAIPVAFTVESPEKRWLFLFELRSGWEREELTFSLNAIRTAINYRLFSETINNELIQAKHIQQTLLPVSPPQIKGFQIAARFQPAEIVGGDFYDFYLFDEEMFGVSIGDASGHGLPASLLVRDVITGLRMGLAKDMKMIPAIKKLNQVIQLNTYSTRFTSLFYGEFEKEGHLIYVNAGHPAPILVNGDRVQFLQATGIILGAVSDISLHRSYAYLEPHSVLLLYTDGLIERENRKEQLFGVKGLKELVVANRHKTAEEILDIIFQTVYEFGNKQKWQDDATVVVIKRVA